MDFCDTIIAQTKTGFVLLREEVFEMLDLYKVYGEDQRKHFNIANIGDMEVALNNKLESIVVLTESNEKIYLTEMRYEILNSETHAWMAVGKSVYENKEYRGEISICLQYNERELVLKP